MESFLNAPHTVSIGAPPTPTPQGLVFVSTTAKPQSELRFSNQLTQLEIDRAFEIELGFSIPQAIQEMTHIVQGLARTAMGATSSIFQIGIRAGALYIRYRRFHKLHTVSLFPVNPEEVYTLQLRCFIHINEKGFLELWSQGRRVWHFFHCTTSFSPKHNPWIQIGCSRIFTHRPLQRVRIQSVHIRSLTSPFITSHYRAITHVYPFYNTTFTLNLLPQTQKVVCRLNGIVFYQRRIEHQRFVTISRALLIGCCQRATTPHMLLYIEMLDADATCIRSHICALVRSTPPEMDVIR